MISVQRGSPVGPSVLPEAPGRSSLTVASGRGIGFWRWNGSGYESHQDQEARFLGTPVSAVLDRI